MKCPRCGWIIRRDHGKPVVHPCLTWKKQEAVRRAAERIGKKVEKGEVRYGHYLDGEREAEGGVG